MKTAAVLALTLALAGVLQAKAPRPPSNLTAKALGVNAFLLEWKDNSNNETGWEVLAAVGTTLRPSRFMLIPTPNLTSYVVLTNDLTGRQVSFQLRAYRGTAGAEVFSKPTSVAVATAMDDFTFDAPSRLTATALDDGRIRLAWKDRSTAESGYQIEFRKASGKWQTLGTTNPDKRFSLVTQGFDPATAYLFRVRAFRQDAAGFTDYSNVATVRTQPFRAPTRLAATPDGEGAISLKWRDRSSAEAGFEIESRTGTAAFAKLGELGANVTSTSPITGFTLGGTFAFRIRGFRIVDGKRLYTSYSNTAQARASGLNGPTSVAARAVDATSVQVSWKDNSSRENGYAVEYREKGTANYKVVNLPANSNSHTLTGLQAAKIHEIRVRAFSLTVFSSYSPVIEASTRDTFAGDMDPPIFRDTSFLHTIQVTRPSELASMAVTGLPAGLTFNPATRTVQGKTLAEGLKTATVTATFKQGYTITGQLALRIIRPQAAPLATSPFAAVNVPAATTVSVPTTGRFADPDTPDARRFTTNLGTFDVILYQPATPGTVANFLAYADAGRYQNSFFHRAVNGFVVQGGGFTHNGSAFGKVATLPAITNEPGISNKSGTVAMAKLGGNPNSATSQFFVNLSDSNASNLDVQNGGFTVFGRIAGNGMNLFTQIDALPEGDYTINAGGTSTFLEDVPVNSPPPAPSAMDPSRLIKVTAVSSPPLLRFEATSLNPAVATAQMEGASIRITGVAAGTTKVRVRAIDLDGESAIQEIPVTVP